MTSPAIGEVLSKLQGQPELYLIAVAGVPGAGKTTFCHHLLAHLPEAVVLPMDGYHLPLFALTPEDAARRGAPHTFDVESLRNDLVQLRQSRAGRFPSFDHAKGDPLANEIEVTTTHRMVIVEGLYLLLKEWKLSDLFDLCIFLDCPADEAECRLVARHLASGLSKNEEEARRRIWANDRLNAQRVEQDGCRERADLVITW